MQTSEDGLEHTFMKAMQIHATAPVMCRCSLATCRQLQRPFMTTGSWEISRPRPFCIGWDACDINETGALSSACSKYS